MIDEDPLFKIFTSQNRKIDQLIDKVNSLEVERFAEIGALKGAKSAVDPLTGLLGEIRPLKQSLASLVTEIEEVALPIVQEYQRNVESRRWWKYALMVGVPLVCLLLGFLGGVVAFKSGELMQTSIGCEYFGGKVHTITYTQSQNKLRACSFFIGDNPFN